MFVVILVLLSTGSASAQEESAGEDEAPVEVSYYGDTELIDTLRAYGLLSEWIEASPVSPQASLLLVNGNGGHQAQRQKFLNSLEAWATRTELVRNELARIDAAQADSDQLRTAVVQVRDALVLDDRLKSDSDTLAEMDDALEQLAAIEIPQHEPGDSEQSEDSLTQAEVQLAVLLEVTEAEVRSLNGSEPAIASSGVGAFVGFEEIQVGLDGIDQLIERGRKAIRPAREESERLASSVLAQMPSLHAARMLGSTDVGGLSVVTVDAYVRAAAGSSCSVDWALLAGIGHIESNHGRLGGASVSRSGQVSTTILGPLLDGGETAVVADAVEVARRAAQASLDDSWWGRLRLFADTQTSERSNDVGHQRVDAREIPDELNIDEEPGDQGNGFAVVVDSDGGRLDGNERWDRAIGPMQFLPETWSKWATDGNGDGVSDPHNLYDAAAAAGRFLCDLSATRGSSPSTFVLGYNSSTSYVRSVLSSAQAFRSTSLPNG